jgi:hypothetical protein
MHGFLENGRPRWAYLLFWSIFPSMCLKKWTYGFCHLITHSTLKQRLVLSYNIYFFLCKSMLHVSKIVLNICSFPSKLHKTL